MKTAQAVVVNSTAELNVKRAEAYQSETRKVKRRPVAEAEHKAQAIAAAARWNESKWNDAGLKPRAESQTIVEVKLLRNKSASRRRRGGLSTPSSKRKREVNTRS